MATLDDNIEAILDAIVETVQAAVNSAGESDVLSHVKAVVRGDRARPMPQLPAVWIVPQSANMTRLEFGAEDWALPVSIAALVKGDMPAEAGRESQRITAMARSAALSAIDEANSKGAAVTDIVSTSFDPTARSSERNRTLFWTEAVVTVTFTATE